MKRFVFILTIFLFITCDTLCFCGKKEFKAENVKSAILIERDTGKFYLIKIAMNNCPLQV